MANKDDSGKVPGKGQGPSTVAAPRSPTTARGHGGLSDVSPSSLAPMGLGLADARSPATTSAGAKGGGKLARSETVTVRLDPKLRYLAELAARIHRRTLSSYVEWSIETSLGSNLLTTDPNGPSIREESEYLWDVDEADRFAKLALRYPHLLTHEEQVVWKFIRETFTLWGDGTPFNLPGKAELDLGKLRRNWDFIKQCVEQGKAASSVDLFMKD